MWAVFLLALMLLRSAFFGSLASGEALPPPTLEELKNMPYSGFVGSRQPVTLVDGRYETPAAADAAARRTITLARDFCITGDLDGDGTEEAVALLAENRGASGTSTYLAVVGRKDGRSVNLATALLGDRVQLRGAHIEGGRLLADLVQAGPQDSLCCPGELVTATWELSGNRLLEVDLGAKRERLTLAALAGTEWVLHWWAWGEPVPEGIEITFRLDADRVSGRAACNRYFSAASEGPSPGDLTVGLVGSTKMACEEPQMAAEDRYFAQLAGVHKFSFVAGQLALSWDRGGKDGTMLFIRKTPP